MCKSLNFDFEAWIEYWGSNGLPEYTWHLRAPSMSILKMLRHGVHCEHDNFPCLRSAPLGFEVGVFGLFEKGEEAEEVERRRWRHFSASFGGFINHESQSLTLSQSHSIIPTSLSSFVGQTRCLGALFNWVAINPISVEGLETRIHYTHYSFTILSICVKYGQIVSYTFSFSPVQYCVYLRHPSINCIVLQSPAITKMIKPASDIWATGAWCY